jgi:hypothetical protein
VKIRRQASDEAKEENASMNEKGEAHALSDQTNWRP